ncbi:MAG TPA: GFA family protein [Candidatus Binatia bacterium]
MAEQDPSLIEYAGGCHCGRVRFAVLAAAAIEAIECNCSICSKSGFLHLIVPKDRFTLHRGAEFLVEYQFNTGVARHLFCKICGIKSFYIPRSNPDGYSVNVRCLDISAKDVKIIPFDGRHWEQHSEKLTHLSSTNSSADPSRIASRNP